MNRYILGDLYKIYYLKAKSSWVFTIKEKIIPQYHTVIKGVDDPRFGYVILFKEQDRWIPINHRKLDSLYRYHIITCVRVTNQYNCYPDLKIRHIRLNKFWLSFLSQQIPDKYCYSIGLIDRNVN